MLVAAIVTIFVLRRGKNKQVSPGGDTGFDQANGSKLAGAEKGAGGLKTAYANLEAVRPGLRPLAGLNR